MSPQERLQYIKLAAQKVQERKEKEVIKKSASIRQAMKEGREEIRRSATRELLGEQREALTFNFNTMIGEL